MNGFPLLGILTIIFVLARLAGIIHWSWWLVLAPGLIGIGLSLCVVAFILLLLVVGFLTHIID